MTRPRLLALGCALLGLVPTVAGWLAPATVERHVAQPLLVADLAAEVQAGLLPGQSIWASLGRLFTDDPLSALSLGAGLALVLGFALAVSAAYRLGGATSAVTAGAVGLSIPTVWGVGTLAGPEAAVFFSMAWLVFASTVPVRSLGSAVLATGALAYALLTWSYGPFMWVGWFVLELLRPIRATESTRGTWTMAPVPVAVFMPLAVAPILWFILWPYLGEDTADRLLSVLGDPLRAPYPDARFAGALLQSGVDRTPHTLTGLALTATAFPLVWVALSLGMPRRTSTNAPVATTGPLVLGLTGVLIVALQGGPMGLPHSGMASLVPSLMVGAALGFERAWCLMSAERTLPRWARPAALLALMIPGLLALTGGRSITGPSLIGRWQVPTDPSLPDELVDGISATLPARARLAVLGPSEPYRALLDALAARGRLRADIRRVELFEATHVLIPAHPESRAVEEAAHLNGTIIIETSTTAGTYQLMRL